MVSKQAMIDADSTLATTYGGKEGTGTMTLKYPSPFGWTASDRFHRLYTFL
jgi:hypothetical protein